MRLFALAFVVEIFCHEGAKDWTEKPDPKGERPNNYS
jgi:hypothetical protein